MQKSMVAYKQTGTSSLNLIPTLYFSFRDNFLQVDIFFKELNYEKIEQLELFKLESLFGEIGGFLGLLLGASVLTVCELIDFVLRKVLMLMYKGRGEQ